MDKELFEDVIVFSVSELGAMGPNDMTFFTREGEHFDIDYKSEETPYRELRDAFPVLKECCWNGPARGEKECEGTVVLGRTYADGETHVAPGWRHIYLDYGNHLAVREEMYDMVRELLKGYENCEITFDWARILEKKGFIRRLNSISEIR